MAFSVIPDLPEDIQLLAEDYFDLMHHQDMQVFDRVFHRDSVLYGVVEGELVSARLKVGQFRSFKSRPLLFSYCVLFSGFSLGRVSRFRSLVR